MQILDLQPTLRGKLLWLRPLQIEDFEALFDVSSDPLVWEQHPERHRYQRDVFQKFFDAAVESKGALVAVDSGNGEIIGSSRFNAYKPADKCVEVGYSFLARRCWGKGFNQEMKFLMLDHAFKSVDKVYFWIGADNRRSRIAIERIGARLLETIERQPREGQRYFATLYGLDKTDFLNGPLQEYL